MRILHVTPHLPPDQAANALLPAQLGDWARERFDEVEYVAHPPRAGGSVATAGPVTWVPRRTGGIMDRAQLIGPALAALRLLRMRWLRPSYSSLDDMIALARTLAADREPVLNLLFHSSEAIVGGSPYNRTQSELDAFLDRLDRFLAFATTELQARPLTFAEFRHAYSR